MKTKTLFIALLLLGLMLTGFSVPHGRVYHPATGGDPADSSVFCWVRGKGAIDMFTRWIPADEKRLTRQIKIKFTVQASMEQVIALLSDEQKCLEWMRSTKEYYRVHTIDENTWYSYVQFSIPWPLKNQDCMLKYEVLSGKDLREKVVRVCSVPGYMDEVAGVERISHMEVVWVIAQTNGGRSEVEYYSYSKQPPKFPTWITDPIIQKNLLRTMEGLQQMFAGNEQKHAPS